MTFLYFTNPKLVEKAHRLAVRETSIDSVFTNRKIRDGVSKEMRGFDFVQLLDGNYAGFIQNKSAVPTEVEDMALQYNSDKTYVYCEAGKVSTGKMTADEMKSKYPIFHDYIQNYKKIDKMPEHYIVPTHNFVVFDTRDVNKVREHTLLIRGRDELSAEVVDKQVFFVYKDLYGFPLETDLKVSFNVTIKMVAQTLTFEQLGIKLPLFLIREYPLIAQRNVRRIINIFNSMTVNSIIDEFLDV